MNRGVAIGLIAGALALILVAFVVLRSEPEPTAVAETPSGPVELPPVEPGQGVVVRLFFPGGDERLHVVERELKLEGSIEEQAWILLLALIEGPEAAGADPAIGLSPTLPEGMGIRHVFRPTPDVLLLDLGAPEDPAALAMGSRQELLSVYSLVNTIVLNLDEVERVGLLIEGMQRPTFAGHVDTGLALAPDRRLVSMDESTG